MGRMDKRRLAEMLLEWADAKEALDDLGRQITYSVLAIGETQTVGYAQAKYSEGRKSYQYQDAVEPMMFSDDPEVADMAINVRDKHTTERISTTVVWKKVCEDLGIEAPFKQSEPSVTIRLIE